MSGTPAAPRLLYRAGTWPVVAAPGSDGRTVLPGDLWEVGRHRLLCGDCADPENLERLMEGKEADMLFTDPPYGVRFRGVGSAKRPIRNDDLGEEGTRRLVSEALRLAPLKAGGAFYVFSPAGGRGTAFRLALRDAGLRLRQEIVWAKANHVLGHNDYHFRHETLLYGWKDCPPGKRHWFSPDAGRREHTLWQYPSARAAAPHPAAKPVELVGRAVENSCPPGGTVLDGFGGAGTTMLACGLSGRRCLTAEIDPSYCEAILLRMAGLADPESLQCAGKGVGSPHERTFPLLEPANHLPMETYGRTRGARPAGLGGNARRR